MNDGVFEAENIGMGWDEEYKIVGWHGMEWDGMTNTKLWDGMGWYGMV